MKLARARQVAKWLWMGAILLFVLLYAHDRRDTLAQALGMLSLELWLGASALILVAKLCLVANMRLAGRRFGICLGWRDSYCIYNLTQLAKYIPGSIWQFVGRIVIYRERGAPHATIRDALLAEHFWVVLSALLLAALLIPFGRADFLSTWWSEHGLAPETTRLLLATLLLAAVLVLLLPRGRALLRWLLRVRPPLGALPALLLMWLCLGAALWITLAPFVAAMPSLAFLVGLYAFAYVAGFLVPFAPAGLGVREAVLALGLLPHVGADIALLLAAINRVLYFAVELLVALPCWRGPAAESNGP